MTAIDPTTGAVLALVSSPSFDPSLFVDGIRFDDWDELNNNIDKPMLNRAIYSTHPPGSTFKPLMALGVCPYQACLDGRIAASRICRAGRIAAPGKF